MPLTVPEALAMLPAALAFAQAAESAIGSVPKDAPKPSDYIKCANAILAAAAPLADEIAAQIKD